MCLSLKRVVSDIFNAAMYCFSASAEASSAGCLRCAFHLYVPLIWYVPLIRISFRLNDKRVTAASMPTSIFFSVHPLADVGSTVLKFQTIRFTTHEKAHYFAIDYANVFQIQNDVAVVRLQLKKPPQLGYRLFFDSAT